ncbi:MAG: hypothetical protein GVY13_19835 [Alphaproteobacteria bacterium]|nr:hypothetical protein [Alphaproteobacteria bacterium]
MISRLAGALWLLCVACVAGHPAHAQTQARNVALVISNAGYHQLDHLNIFDDAERMLLVLRRMGFQVIGGNLRDLTVEDLRVRLTAFAEEASRADTAIVYYAGHGIQLNAVNYLVPVDAPHDLFHRAGYLPESWLIRASDVLAAVGRARHFGLAIFDSCRTNPLVPEGTMTVRTGPARTIVRQGHRSMAGSLPPRTAALFSTGQGQTAADLIGVNDFTHALLDHLHQPHEDVRELLEAIQRSVDTRTIGRQVPQFYMNAPEPLSLTAPTPAVSAQLMSGQVEERRFSAEEIRNIQRALDDLGYRPGPVDGILGPRTREAIQRFQIDREESVTGTPTALQFQALMRHALRPQSIEQAGRCEKLVLSDPAREVSFDLGTPVADLNGHVVTTPRECAAVIAQAERNCARENGVLGDVADCSCDPFRRVGCTLQGPSRVVCRIPPRELGELPGNC